MKYAYILYISMLIWGLQSCAPIKPLVFDGYDNVNLRTTDGKAQCNLDIHMKNPNKVGCTLKNVAAKVMINDVYIGNITQRHKIRVAAGKVFTIPLNFETDITTLAPLLKTGVDLLLNPNKKVPVTVEAEITAKKFLIKKTLKYKFQENYSLKDIRK